MLLVGLVRRPHGLKGEVSVDPRTDLPERFAPGASVDWRRREDARRLVVRAVRPHGARLLVSFEGVDDVDAARLLSGGELVVPDEDAVPAAAGSYYAHQIEGWRCETLPGAFVGTVRGLDHTPAGALLAVETPAGREVLIPFVAPIVAQVDETGRRIVIDPPDGLLEL